MTEAPQQEWLLEKQHKGATTAILLGRVPGPVGLDRFQDYSDVLWLVDREGGEMHGNLEAPFQPGYLETLSPEDVEEVLKAFLQGNLLALPNLYCHNSILKRDTTAYNFLLERIQVHCEGTLRARKTREEEGFIAQMNILLNLRNYVDHRFPASMEGNCARQVAAVVGAGPSLDSSIDRLAEVQDRVLVFAADSTLDTLQAHGIQPDATFSIDAEKPAGECVPNGMDPGHLFLSSKSPRDWSEAGHSTSFLSGACLTEDWLADNHVPKTKLQCRGNCGITAVNAAAFLGCSPILLFGMDHATDASGQGHASNVNQDISRGKDHNPAERKTTVPGNYEDRVRTFLLQEWEQMETLINNLPQDCEVWNITDRGARFTQARLVHPSEFEIKAESKPAQPFADLVSAPYHGLWEGIRATVESCLDKVEKEMNEILQAEENLAASHLTILAGLFQDPGFSKMVGNQTFKTIPLLLKWESSTSEQKVAILKETQLILEQLKQMVNLKG